MTTDARTRPAQSSSRRPRPVTVPLVVAGAPQTIITSPGRLVGWSLNASGSAAVPTSTAAFAAAAGATATLAAGASIAGFDVTTADATGANSIVVTVTGASGGTLTYNIGATGAAPENLSIRFPSPLTPASLVVGIAVTVTGAVGTPAGNIAVYGSTSSAGAAIGFIYDGGQIVGAISGAAGTMLEKHLGLDGVYIGTSVAINMSAGEVQGCIYWLDDWHGGDN